MILYTIIWFDLNQYYSFNKFNKNNLLFIIAKIKFLNIN